MNKHTMSNYLERDTPPVCLHALGQPLINELWMEGKALVKVLHQVLEVYQLRERNGEDTAGVLMKCGAFRDVEVADLARLIDNIDL